MYFIKLGRTTAKVCYNYVFYKVYPLKSKSRVGRTGTNLPLDFMMAMYFREMLDLGFQQLDIANALEDPSLRALAYLTLARGNQNLGSGDKAITYCRHALYNQCDQSQTTANTHLTLGESQMSQKTITRTIYRSSTSRNRNN